MPSARRIASQSATSAAVLFSSSAARQSSAAFGVERPQPRWSRQTMR
jgi:hypothetical protein